MMKNEILRLGCGIDVSKDKFHASFGCQLSDGQFKVISSKSFANTKAGITAFKAWLGKHTQKHQKNEETPFQILLEATGVYHENLCSSLYSAELPVCLELSVRVKTYLKSLGQYSKNDKLDATNICRMSCERKFNRWKPFSPKILQIRTALRHRKSLISSKLRFKNRLHAMEHSANSDQQILASTKRMIKSSEKEIDTVSKHIKELYMSDKKLYETLKPIIQSVKGLGLIAALTVVAETNGFDQMKNAKQLASYAGYDIIENQSGKFTGATRISKRGNARIRKELYMCALSMSKKNSALYDFYARIKARHPGIYKKANVAVQRKLLLLIYTLFKNETKFDPEYSKRFRKNSPEESQEAKEQSSSEHNPELHEIATA